MNGERGRERRTCKREVAVSVLTPPKHPRAANGEEALAESKDAAGRERLVIERVNTMLNDGNFTKIESAETDCKFNWFQLSLVLSPPGKLNWSSDVDAGVIAGGEIRGL